VWLAMNSESIPLERVLKEDGKYYLKTPITGETIREILKDLPEAQNLFDQVEIFTQKHPNLVSYLTQEELLFLGKKYDIHDNRGLLIYFLTSCLHNSLIF
jgi:hypothetical protein